MKQILILIGHPDLDSSVNSKHFIEAAKTLDYVKVHDFDPFDIDAEYEHSLLAQADIIVGLTPMMWFNHSSKLQKYIEDVFNPGWCFPTDDESTGRELEGKTLSMIYTTGGDDSVFELINYENLYTNIKATALFCGMKFVPGPFYHGVYYPSEAQLTVNTKEMLSFLESLAK